MRSPAKRKWLWLAALALLILAVGSCKRRSAETAAAIIPAGEPEAYSATVTRTAVDGEARDETVSRVARRGDWRREQWSEAGGERALIWRPDLGKRYLLDLNNRLYIEFAFAAGPVGKAPPDAAHNPAVQGGETTTPTVIDAGDIDRVLSDAPAMIQVEVRVLADQTLQDHPCQVIEERATLANGRLEVTRSRRARDLAGLPLLIEVESASGARLTIERRDLRLDPSNDDFAVPSGFRKVDKLP
jgi:hypothetical protein